VVLVVVLVDVVVGTGQLGPLAGDRHASQQLVHAPGFPFFALHDASSLFVLHFTPFALGMKQVTTPGLPQPELAAHLLTTSLHVVCRRLGSEGSRAARRFAMPAAHETYCPWFTAGGLF